MTKVNFSELSEQAKLQILINSITRNSPCPITGASKPDAENAGMYRVETGPDDGFFDWNCDSDHRQWFDTPLEAVIMYLHHWMIWKGFQPDVPFDRLANAELKTHMADKRIGPIETREEEYLRWQTYKNPEYNPYEDENYESWTGQIMRQ